MKWPPFVSIPVLFCFLCAPSPADTLTAESLNVEAAVKGLARPVVIRQPDGAAALIKPAGPDPVVSTDYDLTKNIVVRKRKSGTVEELPFLALPVLFRRDSDEFLDAVSEENVRRLATLVNQLSDGGRARFQIEGHASREGDESHNLELSLRRAERIHALLIGQLHVDGSVLKPAKGLGEQHAKAAENAPETEREKDRVVRVVKMS